ncbi:MAG: gamma-glutamyltransferase [Alphaproteobacteria bacterium]|nr:gamma-glutamyltransferase [Alphaproteobacteria bacterium]
MSRLILIFLLVLTQRVAAETAPPPTAMIAAADPRAVSAGLAILKAGGNAMDAAVAVQMVLGVVEPQSSGLGGGAVLLHYDAASGRVTSWDGRETAPAAARPDLFLDHDGNPLPFREAVAGGRSVGVPGTARMLEAAHGAYGKLPWADLIAPAIRLAENGFSVSPRLARDIAANADKLRRQSAARTYFLAPDNTPLAVGTTLRNVRLAETLRALAAGGADALNRGVIAAEIAATVRAGPNPGGMTSGDLAAYAPKQRPPVCGAYRGHMVCGMGPPSSGGVAVLQILGVLAHFDLPHMAPDGADAAQAIVEAERLAYADRARYLADSDFVPVPVAGLIAPDYLTIRAQSIDLDHAISEPRAGNPLWPATPPALAPQPAQAEHGTSNIAIVDAAGNAVALTTTIETEFGSGLMVHGFVLNNELTDFSFRPEIDGRLVANRVQPGKRPRSAMAPTLVFDHSRKLELVVGSAGGARIIGYVVQALVEMLDWGRRPAQALAAPHVLSIGDAAELEADTRAVQLGPTLAARGQKVVVRPLLSGSAGIAVTPSGLAGNADPRREGVALGE